MRPGIARSQPNQADLESREGDNHDEEVAIAYHNALDFSPDRHILHGVSGYGGGKDDTEGRC